MKSYSAPSPICEESLDEPAIVEGSGLSGRLGVRSDEGCACSAAIAH